MTILPSTSWQHFLSEVDNAKKIIGFKTNEECFYRGHASTSHLLLPGLYRDLQQHRKRIPDQLWDIESDLFYEFRSKAKSLHQQQLSDWDILFFMQHHGLRTRLLDWTDSLGVAVYFALFDYKAAQHDPCVWIMNPYKFNEHYHSNSRDLWDPELLNFYKNYNKKGLNYAEMMLYENNGAIVPWNAPVALYPVRKAERLATQNGYFTIHGNDSRPIEKIVAANKKLLAKIPIPKSAIPAAKEFLEQAGINQFSLFPDLDGLSRYLKHKYFT